MKTLLTLVILFMLCNSSHAEETVAKRTLEPGYGPAIKRSQTAVVSFQLFDKKGKIVDEATERDPLTFELGSSTVITGLSQGVEGMQLDETRQILVPPTLGYKGSDASPVGANEVLVFEVKLLRIVDSLSDGSDSEENLKERFLEEDFLSKRHARELQKPAMFEYVIRDFFTKPWRYDDGHDRILASSIKLGMALFALALFYLAGLKRGWLIP